MNLEIFTLKFSEESKKFESEEIKEFIKNHKVEWIKEEFFVYQAVPYLTFIIQYQHISAPKQGETKPSVEWTKTDKENKEKIDWKEDLSPEETPLFNALRQWRNLKAREEGYSAYVILTNKQLYEITKLKPKSFASLQSISGIGESKVKKYGQALLGLVSSYPENAVTKNENIKEGNHATLSGTVQESP
jgi:superfamily II DNA helicase RecQ